MHCQIKRMMRLVPLLRTVLSSSSIIFFLTLFPSVHYIDMSEISVFSIEVPLLVGGEAVFLDSTSGWKNELKEERRSSMCIQLLSHFCYKLYGECKINCAMVLITSSFQSQKRRSMLRKQKKATCRKNQRCCHHLLTVLDRTFVFPHPIVHFPNLLILI